MYANSTYNLNLGTRNETTGPLSIKLQRCSQRKHRFAIMNERNPYEAMANSEVTHDSQDDGASQSSQRSLGGRSSSLFERIQRQRELEATTTTTTTTNTAAGIEQAASNGPTNNSMFSSLPQQHLQPLPQQIQVPQYGPMPGFGNTNGTMQPPPPLPAAPLPQQHGYIHNAWNSFTQGMESSMMADKSQLNLSSSYDNEEMHHALLPPASSNNYTNEGQSADEYSISQYFLTFVKDVYGLFVWLPIAARIVVVAGLLYIVVKFI